MLHATKVRCRLQAAGPDPGTPDPATGNRARDREKATGPCEIEMTDSTQQAVDELKARVATMRALGVTRWGDIELGPEPAAPETTSREDDTQRSMTRERQEREREHRLRYGASGGPRVAGAR